LFQQFNEFVQVVRDNKTWHHLSYFGKYFEHTSGEIKHWPFPKFIFYSGHAETVGPLMSGFNNYSVEDPAPGSAMFLEFSDDEKH
jgi:hypothetical protein